MKYQILHSVGLLVRQFDTNNHLQPQAERKFIATLLEISMLSLDFWEKHSDLAEELQLRIAPWVAGISLVVCSGGL